MQWFKTTISLMLLFSYTVVYAHNAIPHEHGDGVHLHQHEPAGPHCVEAITEDEHDHLHDTGQEHTHHKDLMHKDHVDHGFVDYMICAFSEAEHPDTDTEHHPCIQPQLERVAQQLRPQVVATLVAIAAITVPDDETVSPRYGPEVAVIYAAPPLYASPHRGPPTLFS